MNISVSREEVIPEWDHFLETLPDGCYQQTSLWAKLQARKGWKCIRLVVWEQAQVVGGVQMLLRPVPLLGAVGFVSKGPVAAGDDPALRELILDHMQRVARRERILFLKIQPAYGGEAWAQHLLARGARPSGVRVTPLATSLVDLRPEPDAILASMHHKTRYNIRSAERKGLTVRQGEQSDIPTLVLLANIHGEHAGYSLDHREYLDAMWEILSPAGYLTFFIVERAGEPLGASTYMVFGDTIANKLLMDDERYRNLNPQSLLHWQVMLWAKERGISWYDFGGIDMQAAQAVLHNEPVPDIRLGRVARFKLSFGGQLRLRPGVYDVSYVWPSRLTIRLVPLFLKLEPLLGLLIGNTLGRYVRHRVGEATRAAASLGQQS